MKLGDLVFQDLPKFWLVGLIDQVQENSGPHHCGICTGFFLGIPLITEAFFFGVWTIPLPLFILRWPFGIKYRSWKEQTIGAMTAINVQVFEGKPYDIYYSDSDNAIYCSELIAKAYKMVTGHNLSCTQTVADVELSDAPAKDLYYRILKRYPDPTWDIWTPKNLLETSELQ